MELVNQSEIIQSAAVCVAEVVSAYPIPPHDLEGYAAQAIPLIAKLKLDLHPDLAKYMAENHRRFPTIADLQDGITDISTRKKSEVYMVDTECPKSKLWGECLKYLEAEIGHHKVDVWFKDASIKHIREYPDSFNVIVVLAIANRQSKKSTVKWIRQNYVDKISRAAWNSLGKYTTVWIV